MPEITVIVPVYRAENYLHACIDSILSQTFSDIEVFLVNDGSPDGCGAICDDYARKDERVRVIHQDNQGQAAARNQALSRAEGTWVCFVDSDDLIHPQMLQRLYEAAVTHDAGITMCRMAESAELPADFFAEPDEAEEVLFMDEQTLVQLYDRGEYPSWVACAKLIRKAFIETHLFCEGKVFEDNEAVCHWMHQTHKLVRLNAPMYYYRTNPDSTTQRTFSLKKLDYLWALENIIRFYGSVGYFRMRSRFIVCYGDALANFSYAIRYELDRPDVVRRIEKGMKRFVQEQKIRFPLEIREQILDAMHPRLIQIYWPAKGAARRILGVWNRIMGKSKGESQ